MAIGAGGWLVLGCRSSRVVPTCDGAGTLSTEAAETRAKLGYVDRAAAPDRACEGCVQWNPAPSEGACGGCRLFTGPVSPLGTCNVFARKG